MVRSSVLVLLGTATVLAVAGAAQAQGPVPPILSPPELPFEPPSPPDPPPPPEPPSAPDPPSIEPDPPEPPEPPSGPSVPSPPSAPDVPTEPDTPPPPAGPSPPGAPSVPDAPDAPEDPTAPDPPEAEAPAETGSSHEEDGGCTQADDGSGFTCTSTERRTRSVRVTGLARASVTIEDHHVRGAHEAEDGTVANEWEDHDTTRRARLEVVAGPSPATVDAAVTNSSRSHRQDGQTGQGTDSESLEVAASASTGGPAAVDEGATAGVTYRERFAEDAYDRCEVDATVAPAVGARCPWTLADDSGLPPSTGLP